MRRRRLGHRLHPARPRGRRRAPRPDLRLRADHGRGSCSSLVLAVAPLLAAAIGRHQIDVTDALTARPTTGPRSSSCSPGCSPPASASSSYRHMDDRARRAAARPTSPPPSRGEPVPGCTGERPARRASSSRSRAARAPASRPRRGRCAAWLRAQGHEVVLTREPGATDGRRAGCARCCSTTRSRPRARRRVPPPLARAEALLFAADRAEHVGAVVRAGPGSSGTSSSPTATSTPRSPTRAPAASCPAARWRGCPGGPPTACVPDLTVAARRARRGRRAGAGSQAPPDRLEAEPLRLPRAGTRAVPRAGPPRRPRYLVVDAHAGRRARSPRRSRRGSSRCCRSARCRARARRRPRGRGGAPGRVRRAEAARLEEAERRAPRRTSGARLEAQRAAEASRLAQARGRGRPRRGRAARGSSEEAEAAERGRGWPAIARGRGGRGSARQHARRARAGTPRSGRRADGAAAARRERRPAPARGAAADAERGGRRPRAGPAADDPPTDP